MSRYVPWHISLLPLPHGLLNNDGHMRSSSLYMCVNILLLRPLEWRTCIYIYSHIERVCKCNNHKDSIMLLCHSFYNKAFFFHRTNYPRKMWAPEHNFTCERWSKYSSFFTEVWHAPVYHVPLLMALAWWCIIGWTQHSEKFHMHNCTCTYSSSIACAYLPAEEGSVRMQDLQSKGT